MDQYISVAEAARIKGVTRQAIYAAVKQGRLRSTILLGKIGLDLKDLESYIPIIGSGLKKPSQQS